MKRVHAEAAFDEDAFEFEPVAQGHAESGESPPPLFTEHLEQVAMETVILGQQGVDQHASLQGVKAIRRRYRRIGELERSAGEEAEGALQVLFQAGGRETPMPGGQRREQNRGFESGSRSRRIGGLDGREIAGRCRLLDKSVDVRERKGAERLLALCIEARVAQHQFRRCAREGHAE